MSAEQIINRLAICQARKIPVRLTLTTRPRAKVEGHVISWNSDTVRMRDTMGDLQQVNLGIVDTAEPI